MVAHSIRSSCVRLALLLLVSFLGHAVWASSAVSPNISGLFSGSAKGTGYTTGQPAKVSTQIAFGFAQSGNDLTTNVDFAGNSSAVLGTSLTVTLTGQAGDFALVQTGSVTVSNVVYKVFMDGHYMSAKKITGTIIFYGGGNIVEYKYSVANLPPIIVVPRASAKGTAAQALPLIDTPGAASFLAKQYVFASNAKPAVYGAVVHKQGNVLQFTPTGVPFVAQNFNVVEIDAGGGVLIAGDDGNGNSIVFFGKLSSTSASGILYYFNGSFLAEGKLKLSTKL